MAGVVDVTGAASAAEGTPSSSPLDEVATMAASIRTIEEEAAASGGGSAWPSVSIAATTTMTGFGVPRRRGGGRNVTPTVMSSCSAILSRMAALRDDDGQFVMSAAECVGELRRLDGETAAAVLHKLVPSDEGRDSERFDVLQSVFTLNHLRHFEHKLERTGAWGSLCSAAVQGAVIGPSYMSSIQGMLCARQSAFAAASAGKSKAAGSVWGGGRGKRRARQWMDSDSDNDREGEEQGVGAEDGAAGAAAAAGGEGAALMLAVPQGQSYHCWRRKRQRPGSAPPSIRVSRGITVSPTRPFAASSSAGLHSPSLSPSPDHRAGADMAATATSTISNPLRRPLPRSATATACGAGGGGGSGGAGSERGARAATNLFGTTCSSSDGTGQAHFVPALILHGTT